MKRTNKLDSETLEYMNKDKEFYSHQLTNVTDYDKDTWELEVDGNSMLCCNKIKGFIPKPGMTAKFYGKGFGYGVRGIVIEDHVMYYRTPKQADEDHKKWCDETKKEDEERFKKNKKRYDDMYDGLPDFFKNRMDRLRKKSPNDRPQWKPYELFILVQAVEIAKYTKTPNELEKWWKLGSFKEQMKVVPTLDTGHSNNTFGCATGLAMQYLKHQLGEK